MEMWTVGIVSSIIGGLFVMVVSWGVDLTRTSKIPNRSARAERRAWESGDPETRRAITDRYLFNILRALFVASAAWVLPDIVSNAAWAGEVAASAGMDAAIALAVYTFGVCANAVAAVFFLLGLGTMVRYSRLVTPGSMAVTTPALAEESSGNES